MQNEKSPPTLPAPAESAPPVRIPPPQLRAEFDFLPPRTLLAIFTYLGAGAVADFVILYPGYLWNDDYTINEFIRKRLRAIAEPSTPKESAPPGPSDTAKQLTASTPPGAEVFADTIRAAFKGVKDNIWTAELKYLGWTRYRMQRENQPRRRVWVAPGAPLPRRKAA